MAREEITARVRVGPDSVDVIVRKAVYGEETVPASKGCSQCDGEGSIDGVMCQECQGHGWIYDGTKVVEVVARKYGLTSDGSWVLVPELTEYPPECFFSTSAFSVGEADEPGDIVNAGDAYRRLKVC